MTYLIKISIAGPGSDDKPMRVKIPGNFSASDFMQIVGLIACELSSGGTGCGQWDSPALVGVLTNDCTVFEGREYRKIETYFRYIAPPRSWAISIGDLAICHITWEASEDTYYPWAELVTNGAEHFNSPSGYPTKCSAPFVTIPGQS